MTARPSALPDVSLIQALEMIDQKRMAVQERLKETPAQRERLNAEISKLDRALKEKEQALSAKEKSISAAELDLKTSQAQEGEKKTKLNSVKTQKEYDAIKSEIESAQRDRDKLEEKILLLMDEIADLKNLIIRERQAGTEKKKSMAAELDALKSDEQSMQTEAGALEQEAETQIKALPEDVHREYTRLRAVLPTGRILAQLVSADGEFVCSTCNSPVPHQIVIDIKRSQGLYHCTICKRLLHP